MHKCSIALAIGEMQIKNYTESPSYPSVNGYHQEKQKTKAGEDEGRKELLDTVGGN
jgi:hypothetical protein